MQARQSHCDNLTRIQKTVSNKIKRVLANILSLNTRFFSRELTLVIHYCNSEIVGVSETWLSDVIPDDDALQENSRHLRFRCN